MENNVVVIGSGVGGVVFAEEYRKRAPDARIRLLTRETHGHYARPMLSHGFSREDIETRIVLRTFAALREARIEVLHGVSVTGLFPEEKRIACDAPDAPSLQYGALVMALGSDAFVPPPLAACRENFAVLNGLDDLLSLLTLRRKARQAGRRPSWGIVGGGLIGCETASDLAKAGDAVTLFHATERLMERQLMAEDSVSLRTVLEHGGVEAVLPCQVVAVTSEDETRGVRLEEETRWGFDGVIVACGFRPRIALAGAAGLATRRGIVVDGSLRASAPDVYALGDAAECIDGRIYAFIPPIRSQASWLAEHLSGAGAGDWRPPVFAPRPKVHGFVPTHPLVLP
jgi:NAD(P)H-nitrite reductase large subunit